MARKLVYTLVGSTCLLLGLVFVAWWQLPKPQAYIPPRDFDPTSITSNALFNIRIGGLSGCIDGSGKIVIEPKFDDIRCSSDPLIPFEEDGRWGYLSQESEIILRPQFSLAAHGYSNNFSDGLAVVCQNSKCGYIDQSGKYAIQPKFDWAGHFYDGRAIVQTGVVSFLGWRFKAPKTQVINTKGEVVFGEPKMIPEDNFSEGLARAQVNGDQALVDRNGIVSFFPGNKGVGKFSEGMAVFGTRDLYRFGYLNKAGEVVIPQQFKQAGEFSEGLANVMFENGKYGYIDKSGNTVIAAAYDMAGTFYEGRALVNIGSKKGYINNSGKIVIPVQFGSAERFKDGLARVSFDDENPPYETKRYGYIEREGRFVLNPVN